jgi:acyl carrier protein
MASDERLIRAIFAAVDEVNEQLPNQRKVNKSMHAVLIGRGKQMDSLAFVNLIVAIEQKIEDEFGVVINLADGDILSQASDSFENLEKLADYISVLMGAKKQ